MVEMKKKDDNGCSRSPVAKDTAVMDDDNPRNGSLECRLQRAAPETRGGRDLFATTTKTKLRADTDDWQNLKKGATLLTAQLTTS